MKILQDVFPAYITVAALGQFSAPQEIRSNPRMEGQYHHDKARVVVTGDVVMIAIDSSTGPVIVFRERFTSHDKSNVPSEDSYVVTESGKMLAFSRNDSCGCGSRLRGWNPYRHVYSSKDPMK